jgi:hypothetical protein
VSAGTGKIHNRLCGEQVSERDSGWRTSVDGVVSDFDMVTRHLRRRQRQVLRLAWSTVGVATLAVGTLIALNLPPGSAGAPLAQVPALSLLGPTAPVPVPSQAGGATLLGGIATVPSSSPAAAPLTGAIAPVTPLASAPRRPAAIPPALPPAPVADASSVTAVIPPPADEPPPAEPSSSTTPAPPGLVDGLVTGVVHILG